MSTSIKTHFLAKTDSIYKKYNVHAIKNECSNKSFIH